MFRLRTVSKKLFLAVLAAGFALNCHSQSGIFYEFLSESTDSLNKDVAFTGKEYRKYLFPVPSPKVQPYNNIPEIPKLSIPRLSFAIPAFNPASSGSLRMESRYATLQNPISTSSLNYTRFYLDSRLTAFNLPFEIRGYYTSEPNNFYNPGYFRISFDSRSYLESLRQQKLNEVKGLEKKMLRSDFLLDELGRQKDGLAKQLREEEFRLKQLAEQKLPELPQQPVLADSLKPKIPDLNTADSLSKYRQRLRSNDSLIASQKEKLGTARKKYEQADSAYSALREKVSRDSSALADLKNGARKRLSDSLASFNRFTDKIKNFQIGTTSPYYDEFTLAGISVRGLALDLQGQNLAYGLAGGRTLEQSFFKESRPRFNKNILASWVQWGSPTKNIRLNGLYSFDATTVTDKATNRVADLVFHRETKRYTAEASAAISEWTQLNRRQETVLPYSAAHGKLLDRMALQGRLAYVLAENLNWEVRYRRIGSLFKTVGNPFLRNNFQEADTRLRSMLFKRRLRAELSYKYLLSYSLDENGQRNNNVVQGGGINLSTQFRKGFNAVFVYTPYMQGNNHPDTLFRTRTQTSFSSLMLIYTRTTKRLYWTSMLSFSRFYSLDETLEAPTPVGNTNISWENSLQINGNHEFFAILQRNVTEPWVDSLNYASLDIGYSRIIKANLKVRAGGRLLKLDNNSEQAMLQTALDYRHSKHWNFTLNLQALRLKNLWFVEGTKTAFQGVVGVAYSW